MSGKLLVSGSPIKDSAINNAHQPVVFKYVMPETDRVSHAVTYIRCLLIVQNLLTDTWGNTDMPVVFPP